MTALVLIAMLMPSHHMHESTPDVARAIDEVCGDDHACTLDAVATCYVETRCRAIAGRTSSASGPWQQLPRYADHPSLDGMSAQAIGEALNTDPVLAAEQWKLKRDRHRARYGARWPLRYHGGETKHVYFKRWKAARERVSK